MAWWLELHCDLRTSPECASNRGATPGVLVADSGKALMHVRARLRTHAQTYGWKPLRSGLCCPACAAQRR